MQYGSGVVVIPTLKPPDGVREHSAPLEGKQCCAQMDDCSLGWAGFLYFSYCYCVRGWEAEAWLENEGPDFFFFFFK